MLRRAWGRREIACGCLPTAEGRHHPIRHRSTNPHGDVECLPSNLAMSSIDLKLQYTRPGRQKRSQSLLDLNKCRGAQGVAPSSFTYVNTKIVQAEHED
jgi:hypothetical protein